MSPAPPPRQRVLIVDDDPPIRRTLSRILRSSYDVTTASGAKGALRLLADGAEFDVILCDIVMPELTGDELHALVVKAWPTMARRMIFVTGGAVTKRGVRFLEIEASRVLPKPFSASEIRIAVARVAAGHGAG